jgi:pantothenate kinase type III
MLLAVDVGNTNVSFGVLDRGKLLHHLRCESARQRTADEYAILVRQMMQLYGIAHEAIRSAIVASVVPALTETMAEVVRRGFGIDPLVVGPGIKTGMPILYEDPREVGADRIVNAVAGYEWAKGAVIVVDFGTATTFDCVSKRGEYLGGVIVPGVQISADALFARAARLHRVELAAQGDRQEPDAVDAVGDRVRLRGAGRRALRAPAQGARRRGARRRDGRARVAHREGDGGRGARRPRSHADRPMDPLRAKRRVSARRLACAALAIFALSSGLPISRAQPGEPSGAELERLRARFKEGLDLEERARWAEALRVFEEIARAKSTAAVTFHVALCHENLGLLAKAAQGYDRAAELAASEGAESQEVGDKARRRREAVEPRIPKIIVRLARDASGAALVNGGELSPEQLGGELPVDPGAVRVEVRRDGATTLVKELDVAEGARETVLIPAARASSAAADRAKDPEPAPLPDRPEPPPEGGDKVPAIVVGAVGLGALATAAVMLGLRQMSIDEVKATCNAEDKACDPETRSVAEQGERYHWAAVGLAAGGAACLGVATALWFTVGADPAPAKRATVRLDVAPGSARVVGSFW